MVITKQRVVQFWSEEPNRTFQRGNNFPLLASLRDDTKLLLSAWGPTCAETDTLRTATVWDFFCIVQGDLPDWVKEELKIGPDYGVELTATFNAGAGAGLLHPQS